MSSTVVLAFPQSSTDTEDHTWTKTQWLYAISTFLVFCVVVIGNFSQSQHHMAVQIAVVYGVWVTSLSSLVYIWYPDGRSMFVLRCWYYLTCTATMLVFFGSLGTINPANIHLWVPVSFNLGIFLGQGLLALYSLAALLVVQLLRNWTLLAKGSLPIYTSRGRFRARANEYELKWSRLLGVCRTR